MLPGKSVHEAHTIVKSGGTSHAFVTHGIAAKAARRPRGQVPARAAPLRCRAMLGRSELVPFVTVSDADRAAEFYEGVLGLRLHERTPFALIFHCANATLRVAIAEHVTPAPHTVLGWTVTDISTMVASLVDRGVSFERYNGMAQDPQGIWRSPSGALIAWFRDPDGNLLSVTEACAG